MRRKYVLIILILLVIGFASISTTLVLNGVIGVGANKDDFNVIFTEALLDGENTNVTISENKKNISFTTKKLTTIGDSTILNYKVKNTSTQYDANVIINCTNNAEEYIELTSSFDGKALPLTEPVKMSAQEVKSGYINAELTKPYVGEDKSIEVSCSLVVNAESKEGYSYTVNFDSDGGSSIEDKIVDYQGSYGELPVPEKEGYVFLGWYDENDKKIESETEIKEKRNKTLHAKWTPVCPYEVGKTWEFNYTGGKQTFESPCLANYKIETWGARGGNGYSTYINAAWSYGGKGTYTSGEIILTKGIKLYIYIGGRGTDAITTKVASDYTVAGGFNGGGRASYRNNNNQYVHNAGSGGGATDIRLTDSIDFDGLKSRIMVAAGGGGGSGHEGLSPGGYAGGLNGGNASNYSGIWSGTTGASQTGGGSGGVKGTFGAGANNSSSSNSSAGAGGGYYGGASSGWSPASGGSSYISGHDGCNAITENSTNTNIVHTGQPNHYSGYVFTNTQMIAGNATMPSHDGLSTMTGNSSHGYAKITLLSFPY